MSAPQWPAKSLAATIDELGRDPGDPSAPFDPHRAMHRLAELLGLPAPTGDER